MSQSTFVPRCGSNPDSQRTMPKYIAHLYVRVAGWEPMFLFERLVIVGWVQLIPREFEYGRLLLGLIVSILYLAILLNQTPYKRDDLDNFANVLQACMQIVCMQIVCT